MKQIWKTAGAELERALIPLLGAALLLGAILGIPLLIGVWLPDVFGGPPRTLAKRELPGGDSFEVIQYWNHGDFYNTDLLHTSPTGAVRRIVLDADDCKHWKVGLEVDAGKRTATVTLEEGRVRTEDW
jgi:hypothetical protein